jgi:pantoate--beta-alanine ligase
LEVIRSVRELQVRAGVCRAAGLRVALVPTMGALHDGHLALVEAARRRADRVWVSLFVNPTQFNDPRDLAAYPRSFDTDLATCRAAGVDVLFAPDVEEMYPAGAQTAVEVTELSQPLCGAARPGHFRGVTTVVCKLFLAAKPAVAVFGEKDFQQLAVIRRMVRDLNFDVEIASVPIQREADGLARSSRNLRLDAQARAQATVLVRALDAAERAVAEGCLDAAALLRRVRGEIARAPLALIDYAELRDPETLEPAPERLAGATLLALAVFLRSPSRGESGVVRLIDNRVLRPPIGAAAQPLPSGGWQRGPRSVG